MRVNETPNLDIRDNDLSVDRLERYLYREIEKFRKRVFGRILEQIEEKVLVKAKGRVSCPEKIPRYFFTLLRLIKFERHKVNYKDQGGFGFLASVLESALLRLLKDHGTNGSYRDALIDPIKCGAVQLNAKGKGWLVRTELPAKVFQAFKAIGPRPLIHVQPFS